MSKQVEKLTPEESKLAAQQVELQSKFMNLSLDQRSRVANYLNSYNLTAWLYNEVLSDDEREYIDLSMKFVMETDNLHRSMEAMKTDRDVQQLVDQLNEDGKEDM